MNIKQYLKHRLKLSSFGYLFVFGFTSWLVIGLAPFLVRASTEYRQCYLDETCEIGEFLFDDSYQKITDAVCTFSSVDPAGFLMLDEVVMDIASDGWYSITIDATGMDLGLYRSQICCTHEGNYLCLDKSYVVATQPTGTGLTEEEVASAVWDAQRSEYVIPGTFGENLQNPSSLTVEDIWSYPTRTLTSFGTLVEDIWSYSTRSLTTFGTLVADIWSYSSRSLSDFTSLVASIWSNPNRTLTDATLESGGSLATEAGLNQISSEISDVGTQVAGVEGQVTVIGGQVTNIGNQITDVETQVSNVGTQVSNVETQVSNVGTQVSGVSGQVAGVSSQVSGVSGQIAGIGDQIDDISIDADLSALETGIANLQGSVSNIGSDTSVTRNTVEVLRSQTGDVRRTTESILNTVNESREDVRQIAGDTTQIGQQMIELNRVVVQNRLVLERIATQPIIETFIEEGPSSSRNVQSKIKETREVALLLSDRASSLKTQVAGLNSNWQNTTYQVALTEITSSARVLGATTDNSIATNEETSKSHDVMSSINWLQGEWDSPVIRHLSMQALAALNNTSSIGREIRSYGKTALSQEYLKISLEHLTNLENIIGLPSDPPTAETLYGYINDIEDASEKLAGYAIIIDDLLLNWDGYSSHEIDLVIDQLRQEIMAVNRIPDAGYILRLQGRNNRYQQNQALALRGIIDANFAVLGEKPNKVISQVWLEYGSIIFRSLVTNPSTTLVLESPVQYYLPREIREEHIIKKDDWLTVSYDAEKDLYFVQGLVTLEPAETITFAVEVTDVWIIPEDEMISIRRQTETLFEPLKNTSYFAQGSTIKADIEASLDKVQLLQLSVQTPESRIRAYREARVELDSAYRKLDDLKTIVSAAGSVGTLFGFVGGVQTLAVWGLMVILIAGFVFLALYLRMIASKRAILDADGIGVQEGSSASNNNAQSLYNNRPLSQEAIGEKSTLELIFDIVAFKLGKR